MPRVPTTNQVTVGAPVNIVLKADQPTGRTVAGTIATVLTRGNHPRGIKVRLTDGRVGRVQSMANGNAGSVTNIAAAVPAARTTAEPGLPSQHIGLDAYMTRGKQRQNGRGGRGKTGPVGGEEEQVSTQSSAVTCPVCGEFNGDEAAVAHHVAGHFGD